MSYKKPESVLVVVRAASGKVLVMRRRFPPQAWQSVTGSLHEGETPAQAARRELHEETGLVGGGNLLDCRRRRRFHINPVWRARYAPGVATNLEHEFLLTVPVPRVVRLNPREHLEYAWLSAAEAAARATFPTDRAAIARLACADRRADED